MWKELIPLQRLGNFLTPDDPECVAKCEIKNVFCYNWTLEVFSEKMCLPNCYVFQLRADSIFGLEERTDDMEAECSLVFYHDNRDEPVEKQTNFIGGCKILCLVPVDGVNLHSVQLKLELTLSKIHGYNCLSQPVEKPYQNKVTLNIGGVEFQTTKETLTKYIGTFRVYLKIEPFIRSCRNTNEEIFEDRSPKHFDAILNFMRDDVLELPESDKEVQELLEEAKYYRMPDLINLCLEHLGSRISLNIGGTTFQTTKETLTRFDGKFKTMLENDTLNKSNNTIFIDRSPKHFDPILDYMRNGEVDLPEGQREIKDILKEAQYYCLTELMDECQGLLNDTGKEGLLQLLKKK